MIPNSKLPLFGVALLCASCVLPLGAAPADLLADRSAWRVETPFKPAALTFESSPTPQISSRGDARDVGGWVRSLPPLTQGKRYRCEATFSTEGIPAPQRHVWALITTGNREFLELYPAGASGGRHRLSLEFTAQREVAKPELRLYLADTAAGSVTWQSATLEDITPRYQPRVARLGAISGKPNQPKTPAEAVDFYLARLDQVAGANLDLVCLPENINVDEVEGDRWTMLETIPGPTTERLGAKARQHRVYLCASLAERDGNIRYNTAVLIDRAGRLVAKYRKSHLTINEHLLSGITEGDEFVVHETDFGRVGLMVCWDHHFPEVARILALKGAEILVLPNAADAREGGSLWEPAMQMRAVDNHVAIVSAVNFGRSMVVAPDGTILAKNARHAEAPGGLVHAEVKLDDSVANYSGQPIGKRYLQVRRPELYEALLRDLTGERKSGRTGPSP